MSGEGQNVYPVEKLCAGWVYFILRDAHRSRQHLVALPTRCDQGNTQQVADDSCYKAFTNTFPTCHDRFSMTQRR